MDKSLRKASQIPSKHFLAKEIAHSYFLKKKQQKMMADVAKQKHFINYKRDWWFRDELGFEPRYSLPNLRPAVSYETYGDVMRQCGCGKGYFCYQCNFNRKRYEAEEEYEDLRTRLPPLFSLNH